MLNNPRWLYLDQVTDYFPTTQALIDFGKMADNPHSFHEDWPIRLESKTGFGYRCDICGLKFMQWLTIDSEYRRMPDSLWGAVICLDCYRFVCYRNGSAPEGVIQKDIDHSHLAPMTKTQDTNHQNKSYGYGSTIVKVANTKFPKRILNKASHAFRVRNAARIIVPE